MSQSTKHYIREDKLITWLGRDIDGVIIYPKVRNQNILSARACVHHAFCSTIETLHKIEYPTDNHSIDIRWLIRTFPPPTTAEKLVKALQIHSNGDIKASNTDAYPFRVTGTSYYDISVGSPQRYQRMKKVVEHLKLKGPVMGSFHPDMDYNPAKDGIYVSKNKPIVRNCPECDRKVTLRHSVCLVGTTVGVVDGVEVPCFQYLESDNPEECSEGKDGICYMTADSMNSVTIPTIE